jgi:hypothetical protein
MWFIVLPGSGSDFVVTQNKDKIPLIAPKTETLRGCLWQMNG